MRKRWQEKTDEELIWEYIQSHDDFTSMEIAQDTGVLQKKVAEYLNKLLIKGYIAPAGKRNYFALFKKKIRLDVK